MKLHETIALRKGEVGRNQSVLNGAYKLFQKPTVFSGFAKKYEPVEEDGEQLPPENKRVQKTVDEMLNAVQASLAKLWDTVSSVERGNCDARADIVVNGETLMEDVPVTTLLFFEKELTNIRTMVDAIPTLSPDHEWTKDENDGLFKTPVVKTHRNKKVEKSLVLLPQTEHQQGQAKSITVDELAGYWNTTQHSGAMPGTRKAVISGRVEQVLDAVKQARARANMNDAPKMNTAPIINYIFG